MQDHPPVTRMADIPFPFGWYSFLPGTSWLPYDYDQLPLLPPQAPAFRSRARDGDTTVPDAELDAIRAWVARQLVTLTASAAHLNITLPERFLRFMSVMLAPELQLSIWGCCGFTLSNLLVPCPGFDGGYLVCFLRDQQDCLIWCLCFTRDGESCVLAVPSDVLDAMPDVRCDALLGMLESDEVASIASIASIEEVAAGAAEPDASWEVATSSDGIRTCAPSFAAFIERFWIESEIARKLDDDATPLTDAERGYWDQFEQQRHSGG